MIVGSEVKIPAALFHFFYELLIGHGYPDSQIDKHIRYRAVTRALPVTRIWHIDIGRCVVEITGDVKYSAFGQQRGVIVFIGVASHPVVVIAHTG